MNHLSIPRVLLLANDLASTHSVREGIRRSGLTVILDAVGTRDEFLVRLRSEDIDLILSPTNGLPGLGLAKVLEHACNATGRVPVVLIGKDGEEPAAVQALRDGVSDYVRITQFGRLPAIIERALRERRESNTQIRVQLELDRAAEVLRDNQKLIAMGRLAATIAHEINNPLESITNLLYLMETDDCPVEKRREYLNLAQRELNRVVQITKQTLTFSRETSAPVRVQLAELVEEALVLYGRRISDKGLHVDRQYESMDSVTVQPGEMRQVLSNLIANAIEATEINGRLVLRIRSARKWSDHGVRGLRLSVADNGAGISPEIRRRLGEPFFTTKGQGGTGLGLWVSRSILSRYGGNLQLRSSISKKNHGTVFSVFLPTNMRPWAVITGGGGSGTVEASANAAGHGPQRRSFDVDARESGPENDRQQARTGSHR